MRLLVLAYLLAINAATIFAQGPKESVPPAAAGPQEDESHVIYELEISPADEPRPAMKYRLLPNPADLKPGNAATQYYKAFVLEAESPIRTKAYHKLRDWLDTPLHDLDIKDFGETLKSVHDEVFYRSIRTATYRSHCDWEEPVEEKGVHLPLTALQDFRSVGILLAMKAKYEIASRQYDEAMSTGRDAFTLAHRLQLDGESVVYNVVGIAIGGFVMHEAFFVEWIRSPNSPNLYWALSEVPAYVDPRRTIAGDLRFPEYTLPLLKEIDRRPLMKEEVVDLATAAFAVEAGSRAERSDLKLRAQLTAWALQVYDEGYRELATLGYSKELLDQMPVLQVALLARWKHYEVARDELYKWTSVVHGPARDLALQKQHEIHRRTKASAAPFDAFLSPLAAMFQAQLRRHRYLSVLRAIEALRIYAARHGEFPRSLAEVREVPVPDDPVTNAPFVYRGERRTATLTMVRHTLGENWEYEYRLRLRDAEIAK